VQHLEQFLVHLGGKPVHERRVGCVGQVRMGLCLAGVRIDDGDHLLFQRDMACVLSGGPLQMDAILVPNDRGLLSVDDESVHVDELASAVRARTHGQDAGEPLASPWLAPVAPKDEKTLLAELPPVIRLQDDAHCFGCHDLSIIVRQLPALPQEAGEAFEAAAVSAPRVPGCR
jgi:hypothetical protein